MLHCGIQLAQLTGSPGNVSSPAGIGSSPEGNVSSLNRSEYDQFIAMKFFTEYETAGKIADAEYERASKKARLAIDALQCLKRP